MHLFSVGWRGRQALIILVLASLAACSGGGQLPDPTATVPALETASGDQLPDPTVTIAAPETPGGGELPESFINVPLSESAIGTGQALDAAEHIPQDRLTDAVAVSGLAPNQLEVEPLSSPEVGDADIFSVNYDLDKDFRPVSATLRHISEHAAWWVAGGAEVTDEELLAAAENFENTPYKINNLVYGPEPAPGIDGYDPVHILLVDMPQWGEFLGYFSTINQYPKRMEQYSNEKEMMVINLAPFSPPEPGGAPSSSPDPGGPPLSSLEFAAVLGHEFGHLIEWSVDPNEDLWLNEALSELSAFMTVSPPIGALMDEGNQQVFARYPFIQLTTRPETSLPGDDRNLVFAHYGAERLFTIYLLDRFGPRFIRDLVANPEAGVRSIEQELQKLDPPLTFNEVYGDWILANLMNQPEHPQGRFGYEEVQALLPSIINLDTYTGETLPGHMPPYSTFYYELHADEEVNVQFSGATQARLTPSDPYEGEFVWYSNRGDETSFTMTRAFDLTGVDSATLKYRVWYELEEYFDYGYALVSEDRGETWDVLKMKHRVFKNLSHDAYGPGYTGESKRWLDESIDLSAYAGKEILLRFVVNTDLGVNRDGMMLDNIEIPEIDFFDGAEDEHGGWETQGFVRSSNVVPAEWIVWLVKVNTDPALTDEVTRIDLDELQSAGFDIQGFGEEFDFAALVISPTAPTTTMSLPYELTFTGK